ncbi:MAG: hypothetical protein LBK77_03730 [Spirochaetaceae bacterium]|jgi:hypothetical protein|nr:hypothetical protein [Spirochaetaceae bacterium]
MFGVHRNVKYAAEKPPAPFIEVLEKNGKIIFLHSLQDDPPGTDIGRIIRELAALNPDTMSPMEALTAVQRWKDVLKSTPENSG